MAALLQHGGHFRFLAHPPYPATRQPRRSAFYDHPAGETPLNPALMRLIDEVFPETPW